MFHLAIMKTGFLKTIEVSNQKPVKRLFLYLVFVSILDLESITDGFSRGTVSTPSVTHEDQDVLGPLRTELDELHCGFILVAVTNIILAVVVGMLVNVVMGMTLSLFTVCHGKGRLGASVDSFQHFLCYGHNRCRRHLRDKSLSSLGETKWKLSCELSPSHGGSAPEKGSFRRRETERKRELLIDV